ncbi:hypothetical protein [Bacillus pseudomycoides]|uniref:hypothetical protein n=1 Tax=Bacillus pseudomycoides TaxID=64104 RepID=UPI000BF6921E|nr:hypothetical protein [Bacillus pseudomycoides]MED1539107.1 hypothetical protein [Bacillus pseudomycoides]PGC41438.1 hypothetical protein COM18_11030 [Bacillus pseudomycoides]
MRKWKSLIATGILGASLFSVVPQKAEAASRSLKMQHGYTINSTSATYSAGGTVFNIYWLPGTQNWAYSTVYLKNESTGSIVYKYRVNKVGKVNDSIRVQSKGYYKLYVDCDNYLCQGTGTLTW